MTSMWKQGRLMARASGNHAEVWVWPGVHTGEGNTWKRAIWSRSFIPSVFLTVWGNDEVSQLLAPEAVLWIALLCSAIFSEYSVSIPCVPNRESWTAGISSWLNFQMMSLENIKKVVGFRSGELAALHWEWQLQKSRDQQLIGKLWHTGWDPGWKLREEEEGSEELKQPFSWSPHQSWALATGILNLKEWMKLFFFFFLNKCRSLYCSPDHCAV